MPFKRVLAFSKMQIVSSMVWNLCVESISYDDRRYAIGSSYVTKKRFDK